MRIRNLGRTGLKVSELCLGTITMGREADEAESFRMLDRFVDAGGNFVDTADAYSAGASETILGRWLAGKDRDDLVIATKVRFGTLSPSRPNRYGLGRKHIMAQLDASLKRLGTDHVDLYQVHAWDAATPLEETMSTLNDLVRAGKIRYVGASNYAGWQLQKAIDMARAAGLEPFVCLQALYNLLDRELEWELIPVAVGEGLGLIPWSPLRGGWLSGKFSRGMAAAPSGTRVEIAAREGWSETFERYANEHTWSVLDTLTDIAGETGKTPAQVALNWLLQKPAVTAPIFGARNMAQLDDNLGSIGWALDAGQVERLDAVSARPLPYPYDMLARID